MNRYIKDTVYCKSLRSVGDKIIVDKQGHGGKDKGTRYATVSLMPIFKSRQEIVMSPSLSP